jgi:hypothetical protein
VKRLDEWLDNVLDKSAARLARELSFGRLTLDEHNRGMKRVSVDVALLRRHSPSASDGGQRYCVSCGSGEPYVYPVIWPCATLKLVASAYDSWPGYNQEWSPYGVGSAWPA